MGDLCYWPCPCVRVSVRPQSSLLTPPQNFLKFGMKLDHLKGMVRYIPGFLIKTQDHSVNFKNVPFLMVFRRFLEKFTNDFRFFADNVRTHCRLAACEDRTSRKILVLEIIIQEVRI